MHTYMHAYINTYLYISCYWCYIYYILLQFTVITSNALQKMPKIVEGPNCIEKYSPELDS
jgi:hypothetical protein